MDKIVSEKEKIYVENFMRLAGSKLMEFWPGNNKSQNKLDTQTKSDGSFVTSADFASNEILLEHLSKAWPEYGIISEECEDQEQTRLKEKVWILDPLDGTKAFIHGRDDFSILLGLSIKNQVEFGAMYFPAQNLYAHAERGNGAFLNNQQLAVSNSKELRPGKVYYRNFEPPPHECFFKEWMDSGLAFLALCRGDFDGLIMRMSMHKEWDIAAPAIMAEESGAILTDENGDKIKFNVGKIDYRYLVCSNIRIHDQLLAMIPR